MACTDCFKIEMPCGCIPSPPDKPLPFVFQLTSGSAIKYTGIGGGGFGANAAGNIYLGGYTLNNETNYTIAPTLTLPVSGTVVSFDGSATGVDVVTDIITAPSGFGYLNTGDPCTYNNGGGTTITGLTNNTIYYLIKVGATTCRLATTAVNAFANIYINLTVVGTMTQTLTGIRATATCSINANGDITTITLTNPGSGYAAASIGVVTLTLTPTPTNLINVINYYTLPIYGKPIAKLSMSPPPGQGAGVTLTSAKCIFQIAGYVTSDAPTKWVGRWYKNGVAIGSPMIKELSADGNITKLVHFTPPILFNFLDDITYRISSTESHLINFTGDSVYFVQYT